MSADTIQKTKSGNVSKTRDYLLPSEIDALIAAVKDDTRNNGLNAERNALMVQLAFNHALRVSELVDLRWSDVSLKDGRIHCRRLKNSDDSVHFLRADEIRALKKLQSRKLHTEFIFISERGGPVSIRMFHKTIADAGSKAGIAFPVHPHNLRHAKGYQLANRGTDTRSIQTYLGHKNIQNTVRYTKLDANRLRGLEQ